MASAEARRLVAALRKRGSKRSREGMARFGIETSKALGVPVKDIRAVAKGLKKDHALAADLWATGIHEARILATIVDEPPKVTAAQMDAWAGAIDSWDLCDQACGNLFDRTPHAWTKAVEWSRRQEEFVKRAGFALMACLAWHRKEAEDSSFSGFFMEIERASHDPRNFVKKAVNWALRQIGKERPGLRDRAISCARRLSMSEDRTARWIGSDALRELLRK
jgi:3-methyladenine DNA glycosylase AlkD